MTAGDLVVERVAADVYVATAELYTTTTTIVRGADGGCLLVDPAVSVTELAALADWLARHHLHPVAGWATHAHWDHVLWSRALGDAIRYATPGTVAAATRDEAGLRSEAEAEAPGHDLSLFARLQPLSGPEISWPGPRALIHQHDAHAPGHGALFLPGHGVLIAGDMLSDIEPPLLDLASPDPFGTYRHGLTLLAGIPGVTTLIPGHGHVGDQGEFRRRAAADLKYLDATEAGLDYPDPRLTEDWVREEHARALARARAGIRP